MANKLISDELIKIDDIWQDIEKFIPDGTKGAASLRADLAGLLVVYIAASYENCIKAILIEYAASKNIDFETFITNNFKKLNSRVQVNDLKKYAKLFGDNVHKRFDEELKSRKKRIQNYTGHNIDERYQQILSWRHAYAHAGEKNTTLSEAIQFHRYAKHVVDAFCVALR